MKRLLKSRGARKFFGSKMATAALAVIALYVVTAIAIAFGLISKNGTLARVGPNSQPPTKVEEFEERLQLAAFHLTRIEQALEKEPVDAALDDLAFLEREVVDAPPERIEELMNAGWEIYDEVSEEKDIVEMDAFDLRSEELEAEGLTDPKAIRDQAGVYADREVADLLRSDEFVARLEDLDEAVDELYAPLEGFDAFVFGLRTLAGTDEQGRSIAVRAIYSIKVALQVGAVVALIAVLFGSLLGAAAAYFGGIVDHVVIWIYSTLSSIPSLVLLIVIAYSFIGTDYENTLIPVYAALCLTYWIAPCRIVRGETLKIKELEYVQAATAVGFSQFYILLRHVIPNTAHLMFINFSLLFIGAVKSEVILSFLGLGVKGQPSWGIMIRDSRAEVLNAFFWQIGAATLLMFVLVMAFNILSDALQDAFDPKHVS